MPELSAWQSLRLLRSGYRRLKDPDGGFEFGARATKFVTVTFAVVATVVLACLIAAINAPFYAAHKATVVLQELEHGEVDQSILRKLKQSAFLGKSLSLGALGASSPSSASLNRAPGINTLEGVSFWLADTPDPWRRSMQGIIEQSGGVVADRPCSGKACLALTRCPSCQIWTISGESEEAEVETAGKVALAVVNSPLWSDRSRSGLVVEQKIVGPAASRLLTHALSTTLHLGLIFVAWAMLVSAGFVGVLWDMQRTKGALEPWVCCVHQPWVIYGSKIFTHTKWASIGYLTILGLSLVWSLPIHWPFALGIFALVLAGCPMVAAWSMLVTVLFHSVNGRQFARIVLSPITLGVAWSIRVFVLWGVMKIDNPLRAYALTHEILDRWPMLWAVAVAFALVAAALFWLVNWRIGRRRHGLRRAA